MAQRRDLQRERFWRRALERQARGRETIRAFCEREGVKETAFHFWRRELARRDGQAGAARATRGRGALTATELLGRSTASGSPSASRSKTAPSTQRPALRGTNLADQPAGKRHSTAALHTAQFVPLTILPHRTAFGAPIEFLLPGGVTLRIGSDAPWELVAHVLAACGVACNASSLEVIDHATKAARLTATRGAESAAC